MRIIRDERDDRHSNLKALSGEASEGTITADSVDDLLDDLEVVEE